MRKLSSIGLVSTALLASTALTLPTIANAETPAPRFADTIDGHGVDLATGLPLFSIEEGGIGSGPGRVAMQRIWAEGAGFLDNWSGGLYDVTAGGVTKKYVQFAGFSDTFTGSGTSWTSDRAEGATLTGLWLYTARDGTKITFLDTVGEKAFNCPGADPKTCRIPTSITRPDGLKFTLGWELKTVCINQPGEPCAREFNYWRLKTVTSSAGYSLAITYQSNAAGANMPPDAPWYTRTSVTFNNSANPPSPVPTITYARPDASTLNVTDPAGRTWRFTVDASKRIIGVRRPGSNSDHLSYAYNAGGTISSATRDAVTNSYTRSVSGTTATETATNPLSQQTVVITDTTKGRPTSVTDGLNRTTSFQYEANGRLTRSTLPEGNYVQLTYDARGNVTETRAVAKAGSGLADIVTSASFDTTCTNVVTCNKPNSTTDARSNTTTTPTTARTAAC